MWELISCCCFFLLLLLLFFFAFIFSFDLFFSVCLFYENLWLWSTGKSVQIILILLTFRILGKNKCFSQIIGFDNTCKLSPKPGQIRKILICCLLNLSREWQRLILLNIMT